MFVGDELRVEVSFAAAAPRLANLIGGGSLVRASHAAWGEGIARVGPIGPVPAMSKLVRVRFREPVQHGATLVLTLRWEATGASGALFPVLDADIVFVPDGDQATLIGLSGAYRPPEGLSARAWTGQSCTGLLPLPYDRFSPRSPMRSPIPHRPARASGRLPG